MPPEERHLVGHGGVEPGSEVHAEVAERVAAELAPWGGPRDRESGFGRYEAVAIGHAHQHGTTQPGGVTTGAIQAGGQCEPGDHLVAPCAVRGCDRCESA